MVSAYSTVTRTGQRGSTSFSASTTAACATEYDAGNGNSQVPSSPRRGAVASRSPISATSDSADCSRPDVGEIEMTLKPPAAPGRPAALLRGALPARD